MWAGRKGDRVMPIGFWAISRNDIGELIDFIFEKRYGRPPQHTSGYRNLLNHIVRSLPSLLDGVRDDFIEGEIISERAQARLPAEGKVK